MFATQPTLVFSSGLTWFQLLVKIATLSNTDHVSIGLGDHLLHARDKGVMLEPRSTWFIEKRQTFLAEYAIIPDVSVGLAGCLQRVGEPYDHLGIGRTFFGLVWSRALSATNLDLRTSSRAHTCTTFAMMLDPDGTQIPEWHGISRGKATPTELHRSIDGPSFRRIVQPFHEL